MSYNAYLRRCEICGDSEPLECAILYVHQGHQLCRNCDVQCYSLYFRRKRAKAI